MLLYGIILFFGLSFASEPAWNSTGKTVVFEETFNDGKLNESFWTIKEGNKGYGSNKKMCYTKDPKNVKVEGGALILTAVSEDNEVECDNKTSKQWYTSGRVQSKDKHNFTALEFEARYPEGSHLQPGLWAQRSLSGVYEEIDVIETVGPATLRYHVDAHWGKKYNELVKDIKGDYVNTTVDLSVQYHNYTVDITSSALKFYFDREFVKKIEIKEDEWRKSTNSSNSTSTPFSEPKHIIMSLLVGGNWFKSLGEINRTIAQKWKKPTLEIARISAYN